ncbi:hypothetical protein GWI33_016016 [Rhynchophorus ferrugineus]|uniref:Uncharacterized protein n=1 Tax=Rhynchophorus ferrugineus TaxID=354439 RepID=A0A834M7I5_RHYFE|nr:hypothetical protein GWI33_016016 [Rhynchophorus ferrugineus]
MGLNFKLIRFLGTPTSRPKTQSKSDNNNKIEHSTLVTSIGLLTSTSINLQNETTKAGPSAQEHSSQLDPRRRKPTRKLAGITGSPVRNSKTTSDPDAIRQKTRDLADNNSWTGSTWKTRGFGSDRVVLSKLREEPIDTGGRFLGMAMAEAPRGSGNGISRSMTSGGSENKGGGTRRLEVDVVIGNGRLWIWV